MASTGSSRAQRSAYWSAKIVDKCARIATRAGCSESNVSRVVHAAEIGTTVVTTVGGLAADRLEYRFKRAMRVDEANEDNIITLEDNLSDEETENVRTHKQEVAAEIYQYIRMAKAAYEDTNMAEQFDFVERSALIHKVTKPAKFMGKLASTNTQVHVCIMDEGTAAFAFQGTALHNLNALLDPRSWIKDCATDLYAIQRPVKLYDASSTPKYISPLEIKAHKGFQLSFRDVTRSRAPEENLRMVLEDLGMKAGDVQRVVCVGHSLGAALATLCAKWCREVAFRDAEIQCVTVGSPRVGNKAFADDFNTRVAPNESYRVVNKGDVVPCIPHQLSGYEHVSGAMYLADHPTVPDSVTCTWGGRRPNIRCLSIIDHHPLSYLSSFQKLLLNHPRPHHCSH